jgi:hypothetical protein
MTTTTTTTHARTHDAQQGGGRGVGAGELQYPTGMVAVPPSAEIGGSATAADTVLVADSGNHRVSCSTHRPQWQAGGMRVRVPGTREGCTPHCTAVTPRHTAVHLPRRRRLNG